MGQRDMDDATRSCSSAHAPRVHRVFLRTPCPGVDLTATSPVALAARFLLHGTSDHPAPSRDASGAIDLSRTLVVLPGARARRLFLRALAETAGEQPLLPSAVTTPRWVEELLLAPARLAEGFRMASPEMERLAWAHALSNARARSLTDGASDASLIERFEATRVPLHALGELESACLTPQQVIDAAQGLGDIALVEHWSSVQALLKIVRAWLAARNLVSTRDARTIDALSKGSGQFDRVVLIGITEIQPRLRHALALSGATVTACIFAPEAQASRFDAFGVPDASFACGIDFAHAALAPCEDADEIATRLLAWISDSAQGADSCCVEDITIGVVDEQFAEPVARIAASHGMTLHLPKGKLLSQTLIGRALLDLDHSLSSDASRAVPALCALLRGPVFGKLFADEGRWITDPRGYMGWSTQRILEYIEENEVAQGIMTFPLDIILQIRALQDQNDSNERVPMSAFARVGRIVGHALRQLDLRSGEWDTEDAAARMVLAELQRFELGFEGGPQSCTPLVALALLKEFLTQTALPMEVREDAIETVGWLELPFDPATRVALIGVHAGALPGVPVETGLLPTRLRAKLSLPSTQHRRARDGFLLSQLKERLGGASSDTDGGRLLLLCPRVDVSGDGLLPSPMIFGGSDAVVAARAVRFFDDDARKLESRVQFASNANAPLRSPFDALPEVRAYPRDRGLRVTDFKSFIACPYRWHLLRAERLEPLGEVTSELSMADFGTALHKSIELAFPPMAEQTRETVDESFAAHRAWTVVQIRNALHASLKAYFQENGIDESGAEMLFQGSEMRRRLDAFAVWQHRSFAEGFKILAVEAPFNASLTLEDGSTVEVSGKVDRVEYNEAQRVVRLLDFKSFDNVNKTADVDHVKFVKGTKTVETWFNLQLPLYRALGRSTWERFMPLDDAAEPKIGVEVGYIILPAGGATLESIASWEESADQEALALAKEIAHRMRTLQPRPEPLEIIEEFDKYRTICRATIVRAEELFAQQQREAGEAAESDPATEAES